MALITHRYLHFLQPDSHTRPSSCSPPVSLIFYAFHTGPPPSPRSGSVHFPILPPSLRYWARLQLFVGGQNNYIKTLMETNKAPRVMSWRAPDLCWFSPSVSASATKEKRCHHSKQNLVAKVSFHSRLLAYGKPSAAKNFLLESLHIL